MSTLPFKKVYLFERGDNGKASRKKGSETVQKVVRKVMRSKKQIASLFEQQHYRSCSSSCSFIWIDWF